MRRFAVAVAALVLTMAAKTLAAPYTVNSTLDSPASAPPVCDDGSGNCTLRGAIQCFNITPDTISFNIPASTDPGCNAISGVCTLTPATPYDAILASNIGQTLIDATTQPGSSCGDLWAGTPPVWQIVLNGFGFNIQAANITVQGFRITNTVNSSVILTSATGDYVYDDIVRCNRLDNATAGNAGVTAICITLGNAGCLNVNALIGGPNAGDGNVIVANPGEDGQIFAGQGMMIQGNFIGVDEDGITADGSHLGVGIWGTQGIVVDHNLISGNTVAMGGQPGVGIEIGLSIGPPPPLRQAIAPVIINNLIGTDRTGLIAVPNTYGIRLNQSILADIGNLGNKNIISGNTTYGLDLEPPALTTLIAYNYIGLNASATPNLCNPTNDLGLDTTYINNQFCPSPTPTVTATATETATPTATPSPAPLSCCAIAGGGGFSVSCLDDTIVPTPLTSQADCQALLNGFFGLQNCPPFGPGTPTPSTTQVCATSYNPVSNCSGGAPGGTCPAAPPTPTATSSPAATATSTGGVPVGKCQRLVLNQPLTDPPNRSWASELVRRLTLPLFNQCQ